MVDAGDGKTVAARIGKQRTLDFRRQFQLAGDPFLLDQGLGHAGVVDGQCSGGAHRLQEMQIVVLKQAIAATFVDELDGADAFVFDGHRRTQDRARGKPGFLVDAAVEAHILGHVADDLSDVVLHAAPDDALIAGQRQPCDLRRPDAGMAT